MDVAAGIGDYLEAHGVAVDFAGTAAEAEARLAAAGFDLLVVDVQLPGQDGIAWLGDARRRGLGTPAIFLTARGTLQDKLEGFAAGAVDYMVKPFEPAELLARLRAIHAHRQAAVGACLEVDGFSLDLHSGLLAHGGRDLQLHPAGLALMRRLMQAAPRSVSKQALAEGLWGDEAPDSDPLRAHVYQLRQAMLDRFGLAPIVTVRGIGYRFGGGA